MAEAFKISPASSSELTPDQIEWKSGRYTSLYGDDISEGGLGALRDGRIFEVRHPIWNLGDEEFHERATTKCLRLVGDNVIFEPPMAWDSENPALGSEVEIEMSTLDGKPWPGMPDGQVLHFPDGTSVPVAQLDLQMEALNTMLEFGTPVTRGIAQHSDALLRREVEIDQFLENKGLVAFPYSVVPHTVLRSDFSKADYIQMITSPSKMAHAQEFAATNGEQKHQPILTPEAAASAATYYQSWQALTSVLTQSGVIRDGSYETSLSEHYYNNPDSAFAAPSGAADLIASHGDVVPWDYRELARTFGSPNGGVYKQPALYTLDTMLQAAHHQLKSGESISIDRKLGDHTDRLRLGLGTIEVSNMGRAGGNQFIRRAVEELVAKAFIAMQLHYDKTKEAAAPYFHSDDSMANRTYACEIGRSNSLRAALYGKNAMMITPKNDEEATFEQVLLQIFNIVEIYGPEGVSTRTKNEWLARLAPSPSHRQFKGDARNVYDYFYSEGTSMTGAEAICVAHRVQPELTVEEQSLMMAAYKKHHQRTLLRKIK